MYDYAVVQQVRPFPGGSELQLPSLGGRRFEEAIELALGRAEVPGSIATAALTGSLWSTTVLTTRSTAVAASNVLRSFFEAELALAGMGTSYQLHAEILPADNLSGYPGSVFDGLPWGEGDELSLSSHSST